MVSFFTIPFFTVLRKKDGISGFYLHMFKADSVVFQKTGKKYDRREQAHPECLVTDTSVREEDYLYETSVKNIRKVTALTLYRKKQPSGMMSGGLLV